MSNWNKTSEIRPPYNQEVEVADFQHGIWIRDISHLTDFSNVYPDDEMYGAKDAGAWGCHTGWHSIDYWPYWKELCPNPEIESDGK